VPWDDDAMPTLMSNTGETPLPAQTTGHASQGAGVLQHEWRGAWVIAARGAYDMDSIRPLADALETAAKKHPKVVLDASGVTFADSTFLNLLIRTHYAGILRLVAPSPQVQRLCEITGVDNILEIRDAVDNAAVS
jgi:anti-anti-sigma factor